MALPLLPNGSPASLHLNTVVGASSSMVVCASTVLSGADVFGVPSSSDFPPLLPRMGASAPVIHVIDFGLQIYAGSPSVSRPRPQRKKSLTMPKHGKKIC
ncbi:hypothetical protein SUGI_0475370 [Cryptomeria japonica]|nr:hypothetical protein SUGI_0475370 [Cryptomeria japonica]